VSPDSEAWCELVVSCFDPQLIEQGLTSPPTQYRLYRRRFYRSENPTNSSKVSKFPSL